MKNSFVVQYAVQLWLASWGLTGIIGGILSYAAAWFLGDLVDKGIVQIDITIDRLKQALKDERWKEAAQKAYTHATARVYTEEEKRAIRKEYLDALRDYATFGDGVPGTDKNS